MQFLLHLVEDWVYGWKFSQLGELNKQNFPAMLKWCRRRKWTRVIHPNVIEEKDLEKGTREIQIPWIHLYNSDKTSFFVNLDDSNMSWTLPHGFTIYDVLYTSQWDDAKGAYFYENMLTLEVYWKLPLPDMNQNAYITCAKGKIPPLDNDLPY